MRWGHVNVNVANLERSTAFYLALGFTVFRDAIPYLGLSGGSAAALAPEAARAIGLPEGARGRARILHLGDGFPKLDLTELPGSAQGPAATPEDLGPVRLCFGVRDLAAEHARLSALGVPFLTPPCLCRDGMARIAVCRDPDGTLIELIEMDRGRAP